MILSFRSFLSITLFSIISGCSQKPEDLIKDWKEDGWSYVTTHGTKGEVKRTGKLESERAQAIEAAWLERGKRKTKLYQQNTHHYAVLRFIKKDDDEFVVVMKRRK